ncbi:glycosyltransferase family 4 protein [Candidatus Gottesmanbacteria bacterium]|nr:glycosyltransferase family 4 protein [Candidatus Gottesmanbacteria bacterium]
MKVGQIAPIWYGIPPKKYGGTERIVSLLTDGLVNNGIKTTLFATGDSITKAKLQSIINKGLVELGYGFSNVGYPLYHFVSALHAQNDFDIIHLHFTTKFDYTTLSLALPFINKTVVTFHTPFPINEELQDRKKLLEEKLNNFNYISISDDQRKNMKLNFVNTVYNGLKLSDFHFSPYSGDKMLWLSRIAPIKGTLEAIQIAQTSNKKIIICGIIGEYDKAKHASYFKSVEKFRKSKFAIFVGEKYAKDKINLFQRAKVFIFPLQWEEPFGLVLIEAMACGTPVIAYARGAIPEIIKDGETGFIINPSEKDKRGNFIVKKTGQAGFVEAINKIYNMSPEEYEVMRCASRAHVENSFTDEAMVKEYIKVYQKVLARN